MKQIHVVAEGFKAGEVAITAVSTTSDLESWVIGVNGANKREIFKNVRLQVAGIVYKQ